MDEINDFFIQGANSEDQDDLLAELDELEALNEEEELAKLGVGASALPNVGGGVAVGASAQVHAP